MSDCGCGKGLCPNFATEEARTRLCRCGTQYECPRRSARAREALSHAPVTTGQVRPHQVGWLRRTDHETDDQQKRGLQVWELPDGRLTLTQGEPVLTVLKKGTHS
jgi:hypothetical protein